MARIFISHSSHNNAEAFALRDWLIEQGWHELFLDIDPKRGIAAGQRWLDALAAAGQRAKAVLFIVTRAWLASDYCRTEFFSAKEKGKALFGLIVDDTPLSAAPAEMTAVWQFANLTVGSQFRTLCVTAPPDYCQKGILFSMEGLEVLRQGMMRQGLGSLATESFPWPAAGFEVESEEGRAGWPRSPFRGLKALEAPDAGVFFGRDADLTRVIDELDRLRSEGGRKLVVILGASGAGKSSFLRAGLLPRLERLSERFLPLPPIRPLRHAISGKTGLLSSLAGAFHTATPALSKSDLETDIADLTRLSRRLEHLQCGAAARRVDAATQDGLPPTLVIAIDQFEELFAPQAVETEAFLELLAGLLRHGPQSIVIATIRTDAAGFLQAETRLRDLKQSFMLDPLARDGRRAAIEGPARRLVDSDRQLLITPTLIDHLLDDAEGGDGLPALAFTLERLWEDHGGRGRLGETEYAKLGGVKGAIAAAWQAAFLDPDIAPAIPSDLSERDAVLQRAMLRGMVSLEASGDTVLRRSVPWADIEPAAHPLLERLISSRLLRADADREGRRTVEFAHEAVLRQPPISIWIEQNREFLVWREAVARSQAAFTANTRGQLVGRELEIARSWVEVRDQGEIPTAIRTFISDSAAADDGRRTQEVEQERQRHAAELVAAQTRESMVELELSVAEKREATARRMARRTQTVLQRFYGIAFIMFLFMLIAKFAPNIPGVANSPLDSIAHSFYDLMRDLTFVLPLIGIGYLIHALQRRSTFVESLEEEWRGIVRTKSTLFVFCEKQSPSLDEYVNALARISETLESVQTDELAGLPHFTQLHDMRLAFQTLDPRKGQNTASERMLVRDAIIQCFQIMRRFYIEELRISNAAARSSRRPVPPEELPRRPDIDDFLKRLRESKVAQSEADL